MLICSSIFFSVDHFHSSIHYQLLSSMYFQSINVFFLHPLSGINNNNFHYFQSLNTISHPLLATKDNLPSTLNASLSLLHPLPSTSSHPPLPSTQFHPPDLTHPLSSISSHPPSSIHLISCTHFHPPHPIHPLPSTHFHPPDPIHPQETALTPP